LRGNHFYAGIKLKISRSTLLIGSAGFGQQTSRYCLIRFRTRPDRGDGLYYETKSRIERGEVARRVFRGRNIYSGGRGMSGWVPSDATTPPARDKRSMCGVYERSPHGNLTASFIFSAVGGMVTPWVGKSASGARFGTPI